MPFDEGHAKIFRDALVRMDGITEKRMFGGLCFMLNGNMLCGVHKDGGMARVGKVHEAAALAIDDVEPLSFTGRRMGGLVEFSGEALQNAGTRAAILALAQDFVGALPAK